MFDVYVKVNIIMTVVALILDNWTHMRQSLTLREGSEVKGNRLLDMVYRHSR